MFVRGGVYRVVRAAMGGTMAKLAVSALIFDLILTGPISSVSAGQYLVSLILEVLDKLGMAMPSADSVAQIKRAGAMTFACGVTLYFFRQNLIGLHESSSKAFKIMVATVIMAVILFAWCGTTLWLNPAKRTLPPVQINLDKKFELDEKTGQPDPNHPRINRLTGRHEDPLGFLGHILPESAQDR
jgi:hypothetical protein